MDSLNSYGELTQARLMLTTLFSELIRLGKFEPAAKKEIAFFAASRLRFAWMFYHSVN